MQSAAPKVAQNSTRQKEIKLKEAAEMWSEGMGDSRRGNGERRGIVSLAASEAAAAERGECSIIAQTELCLPSITVRACSRVTEPK